MNSATTLMTPCNTEGADDIAFIDEDGAFLGFEQTFAAPLAIGSHACWG
jgi:hypothetical protein